MRIDRLMLLALCWPALALANDGIGGISAGGIVFRKTDAVAMKKEVLNISHSLISVDYEFVNESASPVEESIVFPLPAYQAMPGAGNTYYGQPNGFSIRVDGKPVAFTTTVLALFNDHNVTAQLKALGLSDAQIAYNPEFQAASVKPLSEQQKKQLIKLELVGPNVSDVGPLWTVQVNYVWKQTFPANTVVKVHHEYRPFVELNRDRTLDQSFAKQFCADAAFVKTWNKVVTPDRSPGLIDDEVSYILKTGNTWKNGIEDFTLNVIKQNPAELVSLCFPGKGEKINATTYRFHAVNFHPSEDLTIYFGNIDAEAPFLNKGVMPVLAH